LCPYSPRTWSAMLTLLSSRFFILSFNSFSHNRVTVCPVYRTIELAISAHLCSDPPAAPNFENIPMCIIGSFLSRVCWLLLRILSRIVFFVL